MTRKEIIYATRQFANMFGFPVRLYCEGECIYEQTMLNLTQDIVALCMTELMNKTEEISYHIHEEFLFFGIVSAPPYRMIAGPVSELELPENVLNRLAFQMGMSSTEIPMFLTEMKTLSGMHLDTLIQALILYNFSVNRTMYSISDIRIRNTEQRDLTSEIKETECTEVPIGYFSNNSRSYAIERDIVRKIQSGDVEGLIEGATKIPAVSTGHLAPHLLRHQKNFFIRLETICARAGIEAGLDADEILAVEELYITKCESLDNIDRIKNLQYHMIVDYADRTAKLLHLGGVGSRLVRDVTKYIREHISEAIKTTDIAQELCRSRGSLTTEFKKQTGMNLSDYIQLKKIQEAEELLYETNRNLVDISSYLGFSSQSHFCRVFKEIKGITPSEYRDKKYF